MSYPSLINLIEQSRILKGAEIGEERRLNHFNVSFLKSFSQKRRSNHVKCEFLLIVFFGYKEIKYYELSQTTWGTV